MDHLHLLVLLHHYSCGWSDLKFWCSVLPLALAARAVMAGGALLSPKASEPVKTVSGYNADPNLAATGLQSAPPRVVASETKTVPGKSIQVTPSMMCTRHMAGSPKMIGACAEHASDNMSCCSTAAASNK